MSGTPHDQEYSFNFGAATELEDQTQRARSILGRLAAGLAGLDPTQPPDLRDSSSGNMCFAPQKSFLPPM